MNSGRQVKSTVVIAAAAAALVAAGFVFINPWRASNPTAQVLVPSPLPTLSHATVLCLSPGLTLTGVFNECAEVVEGMTCPSGSLDATRVMHLQGVSGDFILYVEVDGGYHGPGIYTLARWPHESLNAGDGLAKVGLREWNGGRLWLSSAGSLTIDTSQDGGTIDADVTLPPEDESAAIMHISGTWQCP